MFEIVDYPIVNFETPVTLDPSTPHHTKATRSSRCRAPCRPGDLGIEYVTLGNNHVYDTSARVSRTAAHLARPGSPSAAPRSRRTTARPVSQRARRASLLVPRDEGIQGCRTTPLRGGRRAGWRGERYDDERSLRRSVTNAPWGASPSSTRTSASRFGDAPPPAHGGIATWSTAGGAGHRTPPHVGQGFEIYHASSVRTPSENFCFDQARLETFLGELLQVDLRGI